jgi:Na+-driven multidrug efflux pump
MFPNESSVYFCSNCGLLWAGFQQLDLLNPLFQKAILSAGQQKSTLRIDIIGVWLIFLPLLLYSPVLFFAREMSNPVLGAIIFLLSTAILYKSHATIFKASKN